MAKILRKTILAAALSAGLIACTALAQHAAAQTTPPAATTATPATPAAKPKKPQSAAQVALRERQKKCGAEWKAAKAAGKVAKGMKWPQYWSACNKRLKAAGG